MLLPQPLRKWKLRNTSATVIQTLPHHPMTVTAFDPEYMAPDDLLKLLHDIFHQTTSGMLNRFLEADRPIRKWIMVSDFVLADPKAFRDVYVYTLFPDDRPLEKLQAHLAKLAPRGLKNTKGVSKDFTDYLLSGTVFSVCFLTRRPQPAPPRLRPSQASSIGYVTQPNGTLDSAYSKPSFVRLSE